MLFSGYGVVRGARKPEPDRRRVRSRDVGGARRTHPCRASRRGRSRRRRRLRIERVGSSPSQSSPHSNGRTTRLVSTDARRRSQAWKIRAITRRCRPWPRDRRSRACGAPGFRRKSGFGPARLHDAAHRIAHAAESALDVGHVGEAERLEHLRGAHRAAADLAADQQLGVRREVGLHHAHEVRVRLHLSGIGIAIEQRHIDRACRMALLELGLRSDVDVGAAEFLQLSWLRSRRRV